ncbi:MAG: hydrolase [Gemmatimonas sp.]
MAALAPFRSAWWLPGAHLATIWGKLGRREPVPSVRWETVEMVDGDFVELAHLETRGLAHDAPRMLILHGLEGGVDSHYVRGLMREARDRGWNATLMLFRTCGPTPNRRPRSYHSGETTDPLAIITKLTREHPKSPLGVVGISLGGNVLCKLLGERGEDLPQQLSAAVAVSAPFDLARASRYIGRGFGKVYENRFLRSLVPKANRKMSSHPELASFKQMRDIRTIWDFDDQFTSPVHGFRDAADYYARSSSLQFLNGIRKPTLLLSAVDDPFLPPAVLDEVRETVANNSAITIDFPANGGHVGFVGGSSPFNPFYYGEWRAAEFLAAHFEKCEASDDGDTTVSRSSSTNNEAAHANG